MEVQITKDEHAIRNIEAFVSSESEEGKFYKVTGQIKDAGAEEKWECTCPQNKMRGLECKHINAVKEQIE